MKTIELRYHIIMAAIYNWRASRASRVLSVAGSASNYHERRVKALSE